MSVITIGLELCDIMAPGGAVLALVRIVPLHVDSSVVHWTATTCPISLLRVVKKR